MHLKPINPHGIPPPNAINFPNDRSGIKFAYASYRCSVEASVSRADESRDEISPEHTSRNKGEMLTPGVATRPTLARNKRRGVKSSWKSRRPR